MARRRLTPEQRREAVLAAAAELFMRKGVDETTISDIVQTASVAQGTFYLYFESKDDALEAVAERLAEQWTENIEEASRVEGSAVERFARLAAALVAGRVTWGEVGEHIHEPEHSVLHWRLAENMRKRIVPVVADLISQAVDDGMMDVEHPDIAAQIIVGAAISLHPEGNEERTPNKAQQLVETWEQVVYRGLGYAGGTLPPARGGLEAARRGTEKRPG